ncbi:hybrid sensor histidine kinase/response regulator transcription factor [Polaribacter sargassicola]|uniref:hybrid sensor histidine kinase/response regulator transcription factor n=1 Tax=Polaribacter sargassicola TaxID=2836891 RepID=UPI001F37B651|nr:hybrid sensor histidine kinase/response regulator transcription factor [Polaribacter sp. DS7-9]MCG1037424.1 response regulator [Polaribacter sp. DS7-9]
MNLKLYIFFFFCVISSVTFGQFNNLKFENIDTIDGLSSSTCVEIFQDKEGFMWFGTIDGLNKYNGYEFEIFRSVLGNSESISNNRINAIEEDNEGNLWIGTNNGLNFFNKRTNKFSQINLYKQLSLSNSSQKNINDLLYDSINNIIWVATNNGAIKIVLGDDNVNTKNYHFSYYINDQSNLNSIDNNGVNVILKDDDNKIWIGTNGKHLNQYNPLKDNFNRVYIDHKKPYELNHIPKRIFIDADGDFWIGNDLNNFILWNRERNRFSHVSLAENHTPIFSIFQDNDGLFWVPTEGQGLYLLNKNDENIKIEKHLKNTISDPFSLPNNKPSKVFQDKNGIYWIGSYDKGVSKLDLTKHSFGHYYYKQDNDNGLSAKTVQSVLQDHKGRIWISSYNGGLNLFDEENNQFKKDIHNVKNKNSLSSNKILYTFESHDGYIWICTLDGGLNRFNPETNQIKQFLHSDNDSLSIGQNSVWAGVEDDKNRIWFGLRTEGLSMYNPKNNHFTNYKNNYGKKNNLTSNNILCVFIDSNNRLLIGTSLGVNMVDLNTLEDFTPKHIEFTEIKGNGIENNGINYITEDHNKNIWIGTDSGVHQLDNNLKLKKSYTSQNGLPNNLVVGIVEDDNYNFWITTKGGLSFLNSKTQKFKNFNIHDGLQGPEFQSKSIEKTKDGRIIIGGINGFNIFNPNDINAPEPVLLQPKITAFKLNNKLVKVGDSINKRVLLKKTISETKNLELHYNENYISFEFLSLYFENPGQIQYAYKMDGIDNDFINIGNNRVVNHSNLQAGNYTFEVKSSIDGQWDKAKITKINIKILPPMWLTWWAYLLYFLVGSLFFGIILHYYTRKVKESQEHELDQMKLKFFINVSHEFRTPLTLILNPADKILSNFHSDNEIKNSAITIQRSARRLLHLVNQLLDYRKMDVGMAPLQYEKGDIVSFSREIFCLFKDLAAKKEIHYEFKTSFNAINTLFDFDKVEKIITNLISNAIKFTNNDGRITVSIDKIKEVKTKSKFSFFKKEHLTDYVEIIVEDTGVGLNKHQIKNVFSRFYNLDITKAGTGIGLNFTRGLVELCGGEIFIESEQKKGSKFIVRLPLNIKAKAEKVENIKNEFLINSMKAVEYDMFISNDSLKDNNTEEQKPSADKKLPTVLIVEDNIELRRHLTNDLKDSYIIKEAPNGASGLKMTKKYYPDIVISDVMMPKMDGFEMCKMIKTDFETCHIPVLLLTARTLDEDKINGYDNGADGYISKPFVTSLLKARVNNLLETKKRLRDRFSKIGGSILANEVTTTNIDEVFLDKVTKVILENISDIDFKQDHLLKEIGIGKSQFYRKINALTGLNPSGYIRNIRLKHASELLLQKQYSIKEVTHMCGFNSTAYFSKTFKELFNQTPTQYIENKTDTNNNDD